MTGEELKQTRRALNWTTYELANALHVSPVTIRRWESNQKQIPATIVLLLSLAMEYDLVKDWLTDHAILFDKDE